MGLLAAIFIWLREQFENIVDFLASLYLEQNKECIPSLDGSSKIMLESATSLAAKIRKGQITSEHLVKTCIERIEIVNPFINAVTDERYQDAIAEAQQIDKLIAQGNADELFAKKPFLGVPFTAKESFAAAGMIQTVGLLKRRNARATEDAEAIRLMKESGAILIAVSNNPEVNKWCETRNMVYGQTNNPFHTGRTVGGSSGGEAALVSSFCSPIGICTDIGGSTRMPAFFCGLFGHNPTGNTTNMRGATFRTGFEKDSMVSTGTVVKHAVDIIPIMKILTAEKAKLLNFDSHVDLTKLKYYYVDETNENRCSAIQPDIKRKMESVVETLNETVARNNPVVKIKLEGFRYMYRLWRYWMSQEPADFVHLLGNKERRPNAFIELFKKAIGMSEFTMAAIFGLFDLQVFPQEKSSWAIPVYEKLKAELMELLGSDGVLIFYSSPQTAPYHYVPLSRPYNFAYWAIFNALRFPSTQVPLGLDSENLPLGLQVVAAPYNDRLCIAVAKHLEQEFGGFVPPCNTVD